MGLLRGRFGAIYVTVNTSHPISAARVMAIGLLGWWQLPNSLVSLPLIGFGLAAIFPTIIWLIPKRLPEVLVPAAVGFATSAASVGAALILAGVGWVASGAGLAVVPLLMLPLAIAMAGLHGLLVRSR